MMMQNKVYDILKYVALIALPAVATLYSCLAKIWDLPWEIAIPATIMAVDTFLGALLQISTNKYYGQHEGDSEGETEKNESAE